MDNKEEVDKGFKEFQKVKICEEFNSWIKHPYTSRIFEWIEKERARNSESAEMFSFKAPPNIDGVMLNIHANRTLSTLVLKLKQPLIPE